MMEAQVSERKEIKAARMAYRAERVNEKLQHAYDSFAGGTIKVELYLMREDIAYLRDVIRIGIGEIVKP